jgi:RimJ/RimL family protein N-acetyltransferase
MPGVTDQTATAPEIRTVRLLLRRPMLADADAYYEIASDPEYARFGSRGPVDRESTVRALMRIVSIPWEQRPEFAIVLDGRVVGRVMLDLDRPNGIAALGYGIGRAWWGLGLATEAARAAMDYAFDGLHVAKVWARVDPRNVGSLRVLEKLGMQREGLLRGHLIYRGERVDRAYYGLLRAEWLAAR